MREILFIRHGATAGNLEKRYIGRTDEPLCPAGVDQVLALGQRKLRADRLFVSPALRTRQTAELLFPGMAATVVPGLWETDFGRFEGKTASELADDEAYRAWVDAGCLGPIPDGETVADFKARCVAAFLTTAEKLPDNTTAAFVIHGGCIMAILEALALPRRDFYAYHIPNGGCIRCIWAEGALQVRDGGPTPASDE